MKSKQNPKPNPKPNPRQPAESLEARPSPKPSLEARRQSLLALAGAGSFVTLKGGLCRGALGGGPCQGPQMEKSHKTMMSWKDVSEFPD